MESIVDILSELINVNSYDTKDNKDICSYITNKLKNKVEDIVLIPCAGNTNKNNILIGVNTPLKDISNAVVLSAHIDTVLPNNNTVATITEDKVCGLGACDMKSYVANIIYNIEYLKSYARPVIIALTADEETELKGIEDIIAYMQSVNISIDFVLLGEPTDLELVVANKGCMEYQVNIVGKSCHSSNPGNGINAIYVMSALVKYIEELNNEYFSCGISLNVGTISGGKQVNMVAGECSIVFDLRLKNINQKKMILNKIYSKMEMLSTIYSADIILEEKLFIPPLENKKEVVLNRISQVLNKDLLEVDYGTEAGYYQLIGATSLIFGAGSISVAHSKDEYVSIANLEKYNIDFIKLLECIK